MSLSRRDFLETTALAGLAARTLTAGIERRKGMPMRLLGKTAASVSILGFGCGSRFLMYKEEDKAVEALNRALDLGINYVDTAFNYGHGESERRVGLVMKTRRKEVWLATKIGDRKYDDVMRVMEGSLKRLQTDQVDLVHIHALTTAEDLAAIEAPDGALKAFYRIRDEKMARFIGVTCHADPAVLRTMLERHDLDCTQMALNAARMGAGAPSNHRGYSPSFEKIALPVALRKNMGVTAMKIFAQEKLSGDATPEELLRYDMSLPVASCVVGMPKLRYIEQNVQIAKSFQPMPRPEMNHLADRLIRAKKASLDRYFLHHQDICDPCGVQPA